VSKTRLNIVLILLFTVLGFTVMGYHPGLEDDGVYLAAIKADLQPALYPHDSDFFRLQLQATLFDRWIAGFVIATGISLPWAELIWQFLSLFGIMWAVHNIAQQLFPEARAQWAGVAMVAAMLSLPVAGTAVNIADQYLHPRNLATAIILAAVARILARKAWQAAVLLLLAFVVHPIMAAMGISFCLFLHVALMEPVHVSLRSSHGSVAAAAPLSWIFESPSPTWRRALETRSYFFLYHWAWYEWLGTVAPLVLFWLLWRFARSQGESPLARFALGVLLYGVFQLAVAMVLLGPASLVRLTPLQPMRFLQLIYVFLALMAGCLMGRHLLKASALRWSLFLLLVNGAMFVSQRMLLSASEHLELPGRQSSNSWLQAFAWVRQNTPVNAYFALDPNYMALPGEDYHSFRALAERSQLADAIKDTAVVTQVPVLGPEWAKQVEAQAGWNRFRLADFERLKEQFGVGWVLVSYPQPEGLACSWHNDRLSVCRIP
jgi:hypothetical protein